jgi:hypothetical protein
LARESGFIYLSTFDLGPLPSRMDGEIVTRVVDFIKEKMAEPIRETRKPSWNELISRISEAWDAMHGNEVAA